MNYEFASIFLNSMLSKWLSLPILLDYLITIKKITTERVGLCEVKQTIDCSMGNLEFILKYVGEPEDGILNLECRYLENGKVVYGDSKTLFDKSKLFTFKPKDRSELINYTISKFLTKVKYRQSKEEQSNA